MYPYFYPSYIAPPQKAASAAAPTAPSNQPAQELPPVPGKTPGQPVEPVTPAPVTVQPPPVSLSQEGGPTVMSDIGFTQAYLKTQIGKKVRIEFLIGTNVLTDRLGRLTDVGISYIIIEPEGTDDKMLCDIYSIKFITFFA
jgi:hypothetical protein